MAQVVLDDVTKVFPDGTEAVSGARPLDRRRRVHGLRRPVGLRQDHRAAHGRRSGGHLARHDLDRRPRGQRRAVEGPRRRDGVPELRPLPAPEGLRQHGLRAATAQGRQARDRPPRAPGRRDPRPGRLPRPQAEEPVRWAAATGRDGPGDRAGAAGVPHGRAAVQPRCQAPGADARRDRRPAGRPRRHDDLRHPRPDRGDDDGRSGRGDQEGHAAAGRRAAGALRPPREPVRRRASSALRP